MGGGGTEAAGGIELVEIPQELVWEAQSDRTSESDKASDQGQEATDEPERPAKRRAIVRDLIVEVLPAILVSVGGSVAAGHVMARLQGSQAFATEPALFVMVSVLMNLKGNIELNVGARLSTLAHVGALDWAAVRAQAALAAAQATGVGFVAGALAMVTGRGSHVAMLLATGGASALGGSGAMALLIGATVRVAHVCGVDPDNVATPVASSVGDASTLLAVGGLASALTRAPSSVATLAVCVVAVLAAVLGGVAVANRQTAGHVRGGWAALAYAAVTSGIAGVVVERSAGRFPALPALVPLVNGVTGNISTVFASRISTSLHRQAFVAADHRLAMAILLLISVPVQAAVLLAAHSFVSLPFLAAFAVATAIHGLSVLVLALAACRYLWNRGHDPDDCVNPLVTGTGDMLGTLLLAMVFTLVEA